MYVVNMYNQMPRRMLCVGERGLGRGEPAMLKTCCKQSLEEGMIVAKQVHSCGLARMEVAYIESPIAIVSRIAQATPDDGQNKGSYHTRCAGDKKHPNSI